MKPSIVYQDMLYKAGLKPTTMPSSDQGLNNLKRAAASLPPEEQANLHKYFRQAQKTWSPRTLQAAIEHKNLEIQHAISYIPTQVCSRKPVGEIFAGEFPTDSFNANIRRCSGGYLILVNRGLMLLLYNLARAISARVSFLEDGLPAVDQECESDFDTVVSYVRKVIRYTLEGKLIPAWPAPRSWQRTLLTGMLTGHAEKFILWHEWSHVLLGHLDQAREHIVHMAGLDVPVLQPRVEDESSADEAAANLLIIHLFGKPGEIDANDEFCRAMLFTAVAGPLFTCRVLSMLEKVAQKSPKNHPPGAVRVDRIRDSLRSSLPDNLFDISDSIDSLLKGFCRDL